MTAENNKAEAIFHEAIEMTDDTKRLAYLDRACGQDRDLRVEVEALLRAHEEAGDFLKYPTLDESPMIEGPGTRIGRYEVLELIGEGGMGLVYLAEQKEPVSRRVALKIIKPGMDSRQVIARFEAERQALALLDHSNIARVLDAGTTETNRPYFVMEHVKGMSITKYCDRHKLSVEKRLKLFLRVCEAVHHAHQKGIIHRDIKPSNILVSIQDDRAIPKIIDFGIAKAIAQPLTQQTLFTRQGQLLGTPEYMSPEQADMNNEDTDTRADIYSLGVVLYELLTGVLPFEHEVLEKVGFAELQRILQEEEPPRPSLRFTALGEGAKEIAERRHTQVVALARRLHRELEWIPIKAMRKDRSRRYRSASEFADDIRNYLDGAPLIAGPETAAYRVKKFVRKHAGSVVTAALVVAVIVLGLIVSTTMYLRAEKALEKEAIARTQAQKAQKVANKQRELVEERAEEYRRLLYFNHIALADASYRQEDVGRVRILLDSCPEDLRGWEWHHLNYISDESLMTLQGHQALVNSVAFSLDGKRIVSGSSDGTIRVWDPFSGEELMTIRGHEGAVCFAVFSPDGKQIVSAGGDDNTVKVWDAATGAELMTLRGHSGVVWSVAFSPDGKRIISSSYDGTIKVWDGITGSEVMTIRADETLVRTVSFSPDGNRIVSSGWDNIIKVWDTATGDELMTIQGDEGILLSVSFSPDGKRIISTYYGGIFKVWDAAAGNELMAVHGHETMIQSALFSSDGTKIVSSSWDGTVKVWCAVTGNELTTLHGHEGGVTYAVFSPDGKRVVSAGASDNAVKVWDVSINPKTTILHGSADIVAFSPDGKHLVSGGSDGKIKVWNITSGTEVKTFRGHEKPVYSISLSPDGKHIVSGGWDDKMVRVWDMASGEEVMTLRGHEKAVYSVSYNSDGKRIVSGGRDTTVKVWDAVSEAELMTFHGHKSIISCVEFYPDCKRVVSVDYDGVIKVWDASSGDELMTLPEDKHTVIALSPDGKRMVSGGHYDDMVKVWNADSGAELMALRAGKLGVLSVSFSPDGKRIVASGRMNNDIMIWDAETGDEVITLQVPNETSSATFSLDGKTLVVCSDTITLFESTAPAGGYEPRRIGASAHKVIDELYEEYGFYCQVISKLKSDNTIDKSVRKIALQIANARLWEDDEKQKKQNQDSTSSEDVAGE